MSGGNWKEMFKGIQENDIALVEFYINSGVDLNYQHPEFMALPLAESIRYNHLEITKLLLAHGADPSIVEMESGVVALELAKKLNNQKAIDILSNAGKP